VEIISMIKNLFDRAIGRLGYEFRPLWSATDAFLEQQRLLEGSAPLIIVDAGAHRGESALRYKTLFPTATVYSFEPFPESFAAFQKQTAKLANVHAFNVALSDRAGEVEFNSNQYAATNSLLQTSPVVDSVWPGGLVDTKQQIRVQTTTIDRFCEEHAIPAIDILKLDVQGAEPLVLKGGERTIRSRKVRLVYTEILTLPSYTGQIELHEFLRMMNDYGFELFNFFNLNTTTSGQLRQLDAIFRAVKPAD
jgi:FkbM family methyltransferase